MRRQRLAPLAAVFALAVTLSAAGAIAASGPSHTSPRGLVLSGHVAGLLPGEHRRLTIDVSNRLRRPVHLRLVKTTVHAPVSGCGAANLVVARYLGRRLIPAGESVQVTVPVSLRRNTPAACQGRVFRLTFVGQASA